MTVDAIEWAVDNDMDVINMSLGSPFGIDDDPSAVASTNAAKAGVIVVTSAGNSGPNQYITGSPGTADGAIATAASDSTAPDASRRDADDRRSDGAAIHGDQRERLRSGPHGPLIVLKAIRSRDDPATDSARATSRSAARVAYTFNGVVAGAAQIAVAKRGTCARVAKAIFGQQAGAAAVLMVNNAAGLPPFEGPITSNPDTGEPFTVTIPFLGVKGDRRRRRRRLGEAAGVAGRHRRRR